MALILEPEPEMGAYEACCGLAGFFIKCHQRLLEMYREEANDRRSFLPATARYSSTARR